MIIFDEARFKNILSYGDTLHQFTLSDYKTKMLMGENGDGKSTILDVLCFGLFGKPYRKIKKTQLINSVNGSQMLVEIDFRKGEHSYMVRRGAKPDVFEIYRDGALVPQDSTAPLYQKFLEKNILGMTLKTFKKIVILGTASFEPFMQMSAPDRRAVVEDILDLTIFSNMNDELKPRMDAAVMKQRDLQMAINHQQERIKDQSDLIQTIHSRQSGQTEEDMRQLDSLLKEKADYNERITTWEQELQEVQETLEVKEAFEQKMQDLEEEKRTIFHELSACEKEQAFLKENDECPTCTQALESSWKESRLKWLSEATGKLTDRLQEVSGTIDTYKTKYNEKVVPLERREEKLRSELRKAEFDLSAIDRDIKQLTTKKDTSKDEVDFMLTKLKEYEEKLSDLEAQEMEVSREVERLKSVKEILNDKGVKSVIVGTYVPMINQHVNRFLQEMDFHCSFYLDEHFDETIRARYLDDFTYDSFSEGEKLRIDLALLFTWREIASQKNSVNTNLLIMDEIMDSSLNDAGKTMVRRLLANMPDSMNAIVISPNGTGENEYECVGVARKNGNFSHIEFRS